jgi:uncharacterized alkaline shock family protein YloU
MTDEKNPKGKILVSHRAIATVACQSALSSYGVVGLAPKNLVDGWTNVILKDPSHGVEVKYDGAGVDIDVFVVLEYGIRIKSVATTISHQVQYQVEKTFGLTVNRVNVHVRGLRISDTD